MKEIFLNFELLCLKRRNQLQNISLITFERNSKCLVFAVDVLTETVLYAALLEVPTNKKKYS